MKEFVITIILIAFFGTIIAINLNEEGSLGVVEPDCPVIPPGGAAVTVPNPEDCSTFYICDTHGATLAPCLNDTWFNPNVGVCDWPINVPEGVCKPPPPGNDTYLPYEFDAEENLGRDPQKLTDEFED